MACATLSGCTAHADLTLEASGTYRATLEMRDSTGTVLSTDTDCEDFTDPTLIGATAGAQVTAEKIGSAADQDALGCRITISGIEIPDAQDDALVSREDDRYIVDLTPLAQAMTGGAPLSSADDAESDRTPTPAETSHVQPDSDQGDTDQSQASPKDSLASIVDASVSVTFPGAVIDAGGGTITGTTVTWTDVDQLASGVHASGYAIPHEGVSWWGHWGNTLLAAAGTAVILAVVALLIARRRRRTARV